MNKLTLTVGLICMVAFSGCYHATIEMGRTPSSVIFDQPWAMSFIYGLVPPPTVSAAEKCTDGVAMVETELSFLNGLVSSITFGIVTPMHIRVTCAAPRGMSDTSLDDTEKTIVSIPKEATESEVQSYYKEASDLAVELEHPVYVSYEK